MKLALWNNKISKSGKPVVVEFWATWCGPCRMMVPALNQVYSEYAHRVDLIKVNVDSETELLRELTVYSIPTFLVYNHGNLVMRKTGAMNINQLRKLFNMALEGKPLATGLSSGTRILRILAGAALATAGYFTGNIVMLYVLGGVVLFSAVYDRYPIWKLVTSRVSTLLNK